MLIFSILIGCSKKFNQSERSKRAKLHLALEIFFIGLGPGLQLTGLVVLLNKFQHQQQIELPYELSEQRGDGFAAKQFL